jgi:predicted porin
MRLSLQDLAGQRLDAIRSLVGRNLRQCLDHGEVESLGSLADGRNQPRYEDDVSYINHYGSIDLDFELSERFSFSTAFHYERNNWTSSFQEDERNGAHENVYQGEAILSYQISEALKTYTGVQYSSRKENFEVDAATNLNVGLGLTAKF